MIRRNEPCPIRTEESAYLWAQLNWVCWLLTNDDDANDNDDNEVLMEEQINCRLRIRIKFRFRISESQQNGWAFIVSFLAN